MKCYGGRALLNLEGHHSTSAIVAEVEDTGLWGPGEARNGEPIDRWNIEPFCVLQISDCDRRVRMEIDFETEAERENALDKVDTMIETLTAFRRGLKIEQRRYVRRAERLKED